jgi:hypothetical protein
VVHLDDDALLARHAELTARDNVIGLEASVATLKYDLRNARARIERLRDRLEASSGEADAIRASRAWKVGRRLTRPFGRLKG